MISATCRLRASIALALVTICPLLGATACADEPDAGDPIEYRRYYVPADRPQDWPKGETPYVPIEKEEFERLIAAAQSAPRIALAASARIAHARYTAKLTDHDSLSGQAKLEVICSVQTPVLLPLDPCGLAIDGIRWDDPAAPEAVFGLAPDGRPTVYVDRSGTLLLDWSLRGRRDAAGAVSFGLELPPAPLSELLLDLPAGMTVAASSGVVAAQSPAAEADTRWRVELGGQRRTTLKVAQGGTGDQQKRLALLQQATRYDFSPGGLDVTAELTLDVHSEPLHQLELDVDSGLQLMSARYGDLDVAWTSMESGAGTGRRKIVIDFPEPLLGPRQQLQLKALSPLVTDQLWTLPTIRPQGVFWQEGSMLLLTPAPLTLDRLLPIGCRESRTDSLPAPLAGESIELQSFALNAEIKVLLSRRRQPLRLGSGAQFELKPDKISATWTGEFRVDKGERLVLTADVKAPWVIDSVKSLPEDDLALGDLAPLDMEGRLLTVHLARALSQDHPVKLQIAAHAAASPRDKPVRPDELELLSFRGASTTGRLLSLYARPPWRLRFEGVEEQSQLAPEAMTPEQRQWFAEAPRGAIFKHTRAAVDWSASLDEQPPRYAAQLKVEATLTPGPLLESYVIRCLPESAPIERCLVHFTHARAEPPRWADGPAQNRFTANRWSAERQSEAGFKAGETWELVFANLQSEPFEIRATRPAELTGEVPLSLVALPEADSQQGLLEVRVTDGVPAMLTNRRLKPLPLETAPETQYPTLRGAFSYDPAGELAIPAADAVLVSRPDPIDELSGAVIWELRLDSRYQADGRGLHLASCRIESFGRPRCSLTMPSGCTVLGAWVDDAAVRWTGADGQLIAPLPSGKRFPTLEVQFATTDSPLAASSPREAPWPAADVAVLSRHWSLWAPPGYDLLGHDQQRARQTQLSWSQRLFGVLGRPMRERRFDPTVGENWLPTASAEPSDVADAGSDLPQSLPWRATPRAGSRDADSSGWREFLLSPADGVPLKVYLVDRATMLAAGWAAMALVFALGRWLLRGRFALLAWLAGALATTALLVPAACSPVSSGALLAVLACLALELLTPQNHRTENGGTPPPRSTPLMQAKTLLLVAILGGAALDASLVCAQEAAQGERVPRPDRVYRVFIPSDSNGKPREGAKYQIPQAFRAELRERAMAASGEPRGWLLRDASYRARLGRSEGEARIEVSDFTVRYRIQAFSPNARVRLPISRFRTELSPDSAVLDGQPVELAWEEGGQALLCDIPEPGSYQLEFKLLPVIGASLEHGSLELSIPPSPAAALTLELPADLTGVEISGALGPVTWSQDRASATAKLGPTSRLAVRWPQTIGGPPPIVEVEELLWLKVRPGSVVVDATLQYQVSGGQVRQVELAADPRLRLIPPGPESPIAHYRTLSDASDMADSPRTLQLELSQPLTDQLSLPLSLLLTETSGIGNLRLPLLKVLGAQSRRRWLAVSVDSGLEVAVQNDETLERIDAADFSNKWDKTDAQPLLAYRLPPGESRWSLATRPRQPHTTVKQVLALSFQRGGALVNYDAELMTTAGYCFQHRLLIPPALEIDSISLQAEGAERLQRWARDDEGMANVFLSARTTGPQRLSLRGRLPTPDNGAFALPAINIEGGDPLPQEDVIQVFRQPAVLVSLEELKGLAEIAEPAGDKQAEYFGRPVAALVAETRDFSATVSISENEPVAERVQVTSLDYEDKQWKAEVEYRLDVEQGVLDSLRFEIPASWTGPFEISPPAAAEVAADRALGQNQLIVRPRTALTEGRHRLTIRGPLDFGENSQVMVPDVRPLQQGNQERFIVLPTQVGVEHVTWDTTQLIPAELPEGSATPFGSPEAFEVYRVAGEKPQAVLNPLERSSDMAKVRLADIHLTWAADGACQAAASFDLEPAGLSSCPLRLPAGWRLLRLSVAGAPVTPAPVDEGWELPLEVSRLPQRIEVVASGMMTAGGAALWSDLQLPAPALGELPVEQTLWTLVSPAGWECVEIEKKAVPIDAFAYEGYRLKSVAAIVNNLSSDMAATTPPAELLNWRRAWLRRLVSSKQAIDRRTLEAAGTEGAAAPFDAGVLDREWSEIAKHHDLSELVRQLSTQKQPSDQPSELWDQVHADGGTFTRFLVHRDGPAPSVRMIRTGQAGLLERLGACAGVVLMTSLTLAASRRGIPVELMRRWPHVLGAAAGIAWWLWLSPSIFGCLIVAASMAAAVRPQLRPARESASAIAQLGSLKR